MAAGGQYFPFKQDVVRHYKLTALAWGPSTLTYNVSHAVCDLKGLPEVERTPVSQDK